MAHMRYKVYQDIFSRSKRRAKTRAERFLQKVLRKQFVHFLHIGKTGGTAVKYALKGYTDSKRKYVIYLHPHATKLMDIPIGEKFFFFLRDPISRFVSGFYSRKREGRPRYFYPWSSAEKAAFEDFGTPNHLAISLSSPKTSVREKAEKAMRNIQHVRDHYWKWFKSEEYFMLRVPDILFIGFQKNLSNDFGILKSKLSLPNSLELPKGDIEAHRNPKNLNTTLNDKSIYNLMCWYEDDFKFINLCEQVVSENPKIRTHVRPAKHQQGRHRGKEKTVRTSNRYPF
jgi:hypothetical protein